MSEMKITVIKSEPFIAIIDDFMSAEDCDLLMANKGGYVKSTGFSFETSQPEETEWRTSETYYDIDNKLSGITEKIFNTVKHRFWYLPFSIANFEPIQSQKYAVGQEYKKHVDHFNYLGKIITDNDRIATMIIYLNDDFEGGETKFHDLNIVYKPRKGSALYFEYKYIPELNEKTLHSGEPVTKGEKVILTSWIRNKPFMNGV